MDFREMGFDKSLICIDRNGNANEFKYSVEVGEEAGFKKIIYRVVPADFSTDDWFELSIVKIDDNTGKVYAMNNNNIPKLSGKGIADKLIEVAATELKLRIISSSNNPASKRLDTEWRTPDANKVWDRLVKLNKAIYDSQQDFYTFCS